MGKKERQRAMLVATLRKLGWQDKGSSVVEYKELTVELRATGWALFKGGSPVQEGSYGPDQMKSIRASASRVGVNIGMLKKKRKE